MYSKLKMFGGEINQEEAEDIIISDVEDINQNITYFEILENYKQKYLKLSILLSERRKITYEEENYWNNYFYASNCHNDTFNANI